MTVYALSPASVDSPDFVITTSATIDGEWVTSLPIGAVQVQMKFLYGSGSGGVRVCLQSSLDQAYTVYDVAVADFENATRTVIFSIVPATSTLLIPGLDGSSGDSPTVSEGVLTPVIGDRLKVKVFNSGTYSNTTLSVRVSV